MTNCVMTANVAGAEAGAKADVKERIKVGNPMQMVNSALDKLFEIHAGFRFVVAVDAIPLVAFTECTLPTLQVETEDVKEGGQNTYIHKLPVRVNAGTLRLKNGISRGDVMLQWYLQVLRGEMSSAPRRVDLYMFDSLKIPLSHWSFNNAYPIKWVGPSLRAGESTVLVEEVELAHQGFAVTPT